MRTNTGSGSPAFLDSAIRRLREAGCKLTNARRTVLEVLSASGRHLNSTEILSGVQERDSSIGRASVFRTLETLSRLAIIRPTYLEARTPVYVLMPEDGHHAHIVCPVCNRVVELADCQVEQSLRRIAEQHNVRITGHLLEVFGICAHCNGRS